MTEKNNPLFYFILFYFI